MGLGERAAGLPDPPAGISPLSSVLRSGDLYPFRRIHLAGLEDHPLRGRHLRGVPHGRVRNRRIRGNVPNGENPDDLSGLRSDLVLGRGFGKPDTRHGCRSLPLRYPHFAGPKLPRGIHADGGRPPGHGDGRGTRAGAARRGPVTRHFTFGGRAHVRFRVRSTGHALGAER